MNSFMLKSILLTVALFWLVACLQIYRTFKGSAWLAGPTVASCLFLLGATVIASVMVPSAFYLAPVWLFVFSLAALHLRAANRKPVRDAEKLTPSKELRALDYEASETHI
ncbi:MAG TPA: hypothetical protein VFY67_15725 [Pyrinomonadaceae bacterium]|nr:hypothetical protein [Pyrinomonadaceae bacterium]